MIYVITCYFAEDKDLEKMKNKNFSFGDFKRTREWAYFFEKEKALRYIKENLTDIYGNGYYNFACIE